MKSIYSTGVFLVPMKIGENWHWVAENFMEDSFQDGECINPSEYSATEEGLIDYPDWDKNDEASDAELADLETNQLDLQGIK